eukprot:GHVN01013394.1.p1 GENE.GHVN01013394.1~~GHVN01013394.1.p1  ORF type:complete len:212 (+),score=10.51 GHVN01013394.1:132-767(+)
MANFCSTKPDTEKTSLLWEIDDFIFLRKMTTVKGLGPRHDHLRSKVFSTPSGLEFCMILYPHGTPHTFGHVGVYIHSLSDIFSHVVFSFVLLDKGYQEVPRTKVDHVVHRLPRGSNWGFPKYLKVIDKEDFTNFIFLLGNKLRIQCEIQASLFVAVRENLKELLVAAGVLWNISWIAPNWSSHAQGQNDGSGKEVGKPQSPPITAFDHFRM